MHGRFKKFGELTRNEQLLFSEALFLQFSVGLVLKIIPFRLIPRLFANTQQSAVASHQPHLILEQIKLAIQRSSPYSPWKNKCLIQTLAARRMLNRRKISSDLSLGVAKGADGKMIAHAWLKAGDFEIVEKGREFSELYLF